MEHIKIYWLDWLMGAIASGLVVLWAWAKRRFRGFRDEQKALKAGTLAMLHDRLYQSCRHYIKQGWVDVDSLDNIVELYKAYHNLGGNGTGTKLYEAVCKLPIKED